MQEEILLIKFEGQEEFSLDTLVIILNSILDTLKIISQNILSENDNCRFVVSNVIKEDYVIEIKAIYDIIAPIIPYSATIFETFNGIFGLKKILEGQRPQRINNLENGILSIENISGGKKEIPMDLYSIYIGNPLIDKLISKISKTILKDYNLTGITITNQKVGISGLNNNNNNQTLLIEEDLHNTSIDLDVESFMSTRHEIINNQWLEITKVFFRNIDSKWEFNDIMTNIKITAHIYDEEFLEKVKNGEIAFATGTRLYVQLRGSCKLDQQGNVINDKYLYTIMRVLEVKLPPKQEEFIINI